MGHWTIGHRTAIAVELHLEHVPTDNGSNGIVITGRFRDDLTRFVAVQHH